MNDPRSDQTVKVDGDKTGRAETPGSAKPPPSDVLTPERLGEEPILRDVRNLPSPPEPLGIVDGSEVPAASLLFEGRVAAADVPEVLRLIASASQPDAGEPVSAEVKARQTQLTELIRLENTRLNRLIINLYLRFTLEPPSDENALDSVCHSIAEYFHADACELLLLHREADEQSAMIRQDLRLYGAFGPWERAIHSPFVRRRRPVRYRLPGPGEGGKPGNTMYFFWQHEPKALEHRGRFLDTHDRPVDDTAGDDVPHQEVWLNFDLASTCRNILGGSLRRPRSGDNGALADGVLKVENRRPRHLTAFQQGSDRELYFTSVWRCAAVRPYIRYLAKNPRIHQSMLNDVGWQRRYEEVVGGVPLFRELREWYASDNDEVSRQVKSKKAKELKGPFGDLVRFVTGAEAFIQHLAEGLHYALAIESPPDEGPNLLRNVPSLFNMANIARAWSWVERKSDHASAEWIAEHRRQLHGIFSPGIWAPENLDSKPGITEILKVRRDSILKKFGWDDQTGSLGAILNDSLTNHLNYCGAVREILLTLRACAKMLWDSALVCENPDDGRSRPHLLVRAEYRRLRRCVEEVLRRTEEESLPPRETPSVTGTADGRRAILARAFDNLMETLAAATMGAHTFGTADAARLLFISRRVDQLLDNRTIALAQSRGIPVCHYDIARLRIDEFALECLERINLSTGAIVRLLGRALRTWAGSRFPDNPLPEISTGQLDLRAFLQCAEDCAADRKECKDGVYRHTLVWVTAELQDIDPWPEKEVIQLFTSFDESSRRPWSVGLRRGDVKNKIPVDLYVNLAPGDERYRTTDWLQAVANSLGQLRKQLAAWIEATEAHKTPRLGLCEGEATAQPIAECGEHAGSDAGPTERLAELRKKLDRVMLAASQGRSDEEPYPEDEDFLDLMDGPPGEGYGKASLSELCAAIAEFIGCDSCAIFFSSPQRRRSQRGENEPETTMRMRAASGRLRKTLQAWRDAKKQGNESSVGGINYGSRWRCKRQKQCELQERCEFQEQGEIQKRCKLQEMSREELEKHMRGNPGKGVPPWPLTNQIWHLGEGRFASSRDEFRHAALREFSGKGCGDQYAYPPDGGEHPDDAEWTLKAIFRNLVGIPIFTRGGRTEYVPMRDDEWWDRDATRTEFHSCYRVVGILKLEGKRPNPEWLKAPGCPWWAALTRTAREKLIRVLGDGDEGFAKEWAPDVLRHLYDADRDEGAPHHVLGFGKRLLSDGQGRVDSEFVDALTDALDARWDPEEIELLVAIAMELGRLLTLRTLHEATGQRIVLGENDIGLLDVRLRDIDDILLANHAAERVYAKVEHELREIAAGLEDEQRKSLRGGALSGPELHKSVVSISGRKKTYASLFAKLVRKELFRSGEREPAALIPSKEARWASIGPDGSGPYVDLGGQTELSSPERKMHGHASLLVQRRDLWQPAEGAKHHEQMSRS